MDLNSVALQRLWERIRFTGAWPTLQYIVDKEIMEKLGVQVNYVMEHIGEKVQSDSDRGQGITFSVIDSMDDLSGQERERLRLYGRNRLLTLFQHRFSKGLRCIVARTGENRMTSLGWFMEAPRSFCDSGKPGKLIEDCFTLPEFRGRGIFRSLIRFGVEELRSCAEREKPGIFMLCSVFNPSSWRAIMKCGFRRVAVAYSFRRRTFIRPILAEKGRR
jgi:RimJ/RimL family protein N-acetyltransferase